jgi:hypothetical protein
MRIVMARPSDPRNEPTRDCNWQGISHCFGAIVQDEDNDIGAEPSHGADVVRRQLMRTLASDQNCAPVGLGKRDAEGGYLIERALEENPNWTYNDLAPWNYAELPKALGCNCAGFRTPAPTMPTTRSGGRRPKSAKARNRGG